MSCRPCDEVQERGDVAYVRVDKANVGLTGCDEHVAKVLDSLQVVREQVEAGEIQLVPSGRTVVRVKGEAPARSASSDPLKFGTRGIWRKPASDDQKAMRMKAVVLEQLKGGLLYIFTDKPMVRGHDNLSMRTATIFSGDFEPGATV